MAIHLPTAPMAKVLLGSVRAAAKMEVTRVLGPSCSYISSGDSGNSLKLCGSMSMQLLTALQAKFSTSLVIVNRAINISAAPQSVCGQSVLWMSTSAFHANCLRSIRQVITQSG